ncbi:sigma-54 interaction domain-containing protein [Noviherbaspirillum sedimenti]|uniref:Sigma-54-dependent Fis family transcriptional regulator n=1 Tax=Noviherbaspirillum sedimenti TaxID=2320865 RepID=A0A3A3FXB4_9BURK|nr:sigma-54 dependent transcriptional regulator [Noviherbaspirillum sedimenti]RJG00364.1 sigma-54-dependent Fis family transcriptional regulator [Noviherbaspirillum sedimenti]
MRYLAYDPPVPPIAAIPDEFPKPPLQAPARFGDLVGTSRQMRQLFRLIARVAPTHANVLIEGESGTGKELVAHTLYLMSGRAGQPLVAINCGAISPQLMEAELFGHERGSFTGAVKSRAGCFERANGGILFLDEVTEMSMDMQIKLLRILETGRFCRVGADTETQVKVRVIAATNRCPLQAVRDGILRSDLYYRLSVFPLQVPPLRERTEDVGLMANVFLERLNQEERTAKVFSQASREFMQEYSWPGNVRELKNAVQRAFILADHELDLTFAMTAVAPVQQPDDRGEHENCVTLQVGSTLEDAQRRLICATLGHYHGNKTLAAAVLGVSLKTLYNRLKEYESRPGGASHSGVPPPSRVNCA